MHLAHLLAQRTRLLEQARLANLALAHESLASFADRLAVAGLAGPAVLRSPDPVAGRFCATLAPLQAAQSVVEEHFTDEDLLDFADFVALATGRPASEPYELTFSLEDCTALFVAPLRAELRRAGVALDDHPAPKAV
jgi:hypothetical protein